MRKTREILRLKWAEGRTHRETARSLGVGLGTVGNLMVRARQKGLTWEGVCTLSDEALEGILYRAPAVTISKHRPDPAWIAQELRRPGVTLELLHLEYLEQHPDGVRYTAFCDHYRRWKKQQRLSMRQVHKGGDKLFVDYSGKKPSVVDPATGEVTEVELFVAVLGASNFTYAEATRSQASADWISSHVRALAYFEGVPKALVPDQLKSAIGRADRYEAVPQRTYEELSQHYGTVILPARPRKPKDKAKVEVGVQVVQRWILARLRNHTFFSLAALNRRIRELLDELNDRPMKGYGEKTRRAMFESYDRPYLKPLPQHRFEYAEWSRVKVNIDYHVEVKGHFYSVPFQLRGLHLEARATSTTVEVFQRGQRVAVHARYHRKGFHSTQSGHMPKAHREHLEWSPTRIIRWGASVGPHTERLVTQILESRPHPEMGYRSCLGILRLAKRYGRERLERASEKSVNAGGRSYRHVHAILKNGLDRVAEIPKQPELPIVHRNVRGPEYYQGDK